MSGIVGRPARVMSGSRTGEPRSGREARQSEAGADAADVARLAAAAYASLAAGPVPEPDEEPGLPRTCATWRDERLLSVLGLSPAEPEVQWRMQCAR
ncbi:MAG: hypothetical protein N2688_04010 [Burkholderiaceae bacterium]|nr:hypothetical protein [Burkholderiaceae bacterium]